MFVKNAPIACKSAFFPLHVFATLHIRRSVETAYTDSNFKAPLSNQTTWPERGGRTTSHFGDGVSFHGAHTHTAAFYWGAKRIFWRQSYRCRSGKLSEPEPKDRDILEGVCRTRTRRAIAEETGSFYSHIWNALQSAVRSPPLTASAACFKMAALLLFIFCWSPPNFHCLLASVPTDSRPNLQVRLLRYRL